MERSPRLAELVLLVVALCACTTTHTVHTRYRITAIEPESREAAYACFEDCAEHPTEDAVATCLEGCPGVDATVGSACEDDGTPSDRCFTHTARDTEPSAFTRAVAQGIVDGVVEGIASAASSRSGGDASGRAEGDDSGSSEGRERRPASPSRSPRRSPATPSRR